jgi:SAM-dependent methyltransferase
VTNDSRCRGCSSPLHEVFADLGMSPLANSYLTEDQLAQDEAFYPLRALVCDRCFLVQLDEFEPPEAIFSDYLYFSSYSTTWVEHCRVFAEATISRLGLTSQSKVVEIASNDGYLLQHFIDHDVRVLGVEPAANVARAAIDKGVPTVTKFFGAAVAEKLVDDGHEADLIVGNNVLAHVPDLHDFVAGMARLLAPEGTITLEFPHLLRLIEDCQFDTIYHEHFSYFSLLALLPVFAAHDLAVIDVDQLPTHGGSLRLWVRHAGTDAGEVAPGVEVVLGAERQAALDQIDAYRGFAQQVPEERRALRTLLHDLKGAGLSIAGYGAPAKGNTLLNYCSIDTTLVDFTVDVSPWKQGRYLPGTHIPIRAPDEIRRVRPDVLLVLPWNIEGEIRESMAFIRDWGGRFLVRRPELVLE